jgi:hypothetical protein
VALHKHAGIQTKSRPFLSVTGANRRQEIDGRQILANGSAESPHCRSPNSDPKSYVNATFASSCKNKAQTPAILVESREGSLGLVIAHQFALWSKAAVN